MNSTAHTEEELRAVLVQIRRDWTKHDTPQRTTKSATTGSIAPLPSAWFTRQSVAQTLARWARAAAHDGYALPPEGHHINLTDPLATTAHLLPHARELSGWEQAPEATRDLQRVAGWLHNLTREPPPGVRLGTCPHPRPVIDDQGRRTNTECGGEIRATHTNASQVRCPTCKRVDTVEAWQHHILGAMGPVPAATLVQLLGNIGIRTSELGIRQRVGRGTISPPQTTREDGEPLYDPRVVIAQIVERDTPSG